MRIYATWIDSDGTEHRQEAHSGQSAAGYVVGMLESDPSHKGGAVVVEDDDGTESSRADFNRDDPRVQHLMAAFRDFGAGAYAPSWN